ncbi:Cytosolic endo-beta-N-acetylglucosaminidase [Cercospora beticola]|uniref:Cytosolic endo-beta-N-acetylglucosaminidase n=1 Tax=Cercospora beticola TaxID=122368 RepID=A0A2G5I4H9_CERBT|nr:Cytosolic endo-beta-N-acetylglucosaminidase [Cercospora beticola]PIA99706.1 Cytosolic endo-beta-N-acetylglucosaminidase [Cercospora beticola]WPA99585.1 hypothetical protein RHO25_004203 [Cercospora beticola]CAK1362274.1 unnamed protein product [Cercospora beticola]
MDQPSSQKSCVDAEWAEQRTRDALKGFTYFGTFDELLAWTPDDADALQKSNTPLLQRAESDSDHGAKVMLIHDYQGGYNDYESCQGQVVPKEQYSCNHLQFVETFVYFSHRLVSVPPPTWTNTCHRNGVIVLGTFIVEPGSNDVEYILQQDESGSFWVARKLANMAKCYGFDGWLINIETPFPLLSWSAAKLEGFLRQLRDELGVNSKVVWYDALTTLNFIWYQNTLNYMNLQFAIAAGSMLTNYKWDPELAQSGKARALESDLGLDNLYFGIDVWAQNYQQDRKHRRVTWPRLFGGGTGTGLGVQVLQELGLNAGLFAPGWSYEHFSDHNSAVEGAIWKGTPLPEDLACDCDPQRPHDTAPYQQHGVVEYAKAFPAGSSTFFHTNFERAFSRNDDGVVNAFLGFQNIQPFETESRPHAAQLQAKVHDSPSRCVLSIAPLSQGAMSRSRIQLAKMAVAALEPLKLTMRYRILHYAHRDLWLQADFQDSYGQRQSRREALVVTDKQLARLEWTLDINASEMGPIAQTEQPIFLESLFICFEFDQNSSSLEAAKSDILEIYSITVLTKSAKRPRCDISDLGLEKRGTGMNRHSRLHWKISSDPGQSHDDTAMPYSPITGPCAHFRISADGKELGRAYALEFVLPPSTERNGADMVREIKIAGIGFDRQVLCEATIILAEPDDGIQEEAAGWVLVEQAFLGKSSDRLSCVEKE